MSAHTKLNEQLLKIRRGAEEREAQQKAERTGLKYLDITSIPIKIEALKLVPEEQARALKAAAFELKAKEVALAASDPEQIGVKKLIQELKDKDLRVTLFVASLRSLEHIWSFYKFVPPEKAPITSRVNIEKQRTITLIEELKTLTEVRRTVSEFDFENLSITEFLEIVLAGALANRASDIHFEPEEKAIKLRYRVDGILYDVVNDLARGFYPSVISRIKLLSNLKINVSDRPQDGRFSIGLAAKEIEIRVAVAPSEFGEIIVMRVLDPDAINLTLQELGLRADDLEIIKTELNRPNGMILNTGPTGSGKTTTLYAFLKSKYSSEIKIITVEDPIEYHLPGIEQTQVNEEAGYTFANGLRSIMRQDPDAILVGEVRDKDTAEIAIQAALTGHLVFSTVHANDAAGAIPRLLDLGVKPTSIGPALNLIIAQRLVRRLCESCKVRAAISSALEADIENFIKQLPKRARGEAPEETAIYTAKGCDACGKNGYRGRVAIFELFLNDPEYETLLTDASHKALSSETGLDELIVKQMGASAFERFALAEGMVTMQQDGVLKALSGITTFEEVEEATGKIHWLSAEASQARGKR